MRRVLIPPQTSPAVPSAGSVIFDFHGETMGTSWTVKLAAIPVAAPNWRDELQRGIQQQLDTIVAQMSHWLHDSDLGRFNRANADSWQTLPDAFFEVLSYALNVAKISDGAYDPTAGALVNIWGFGPSHRYDEADFCPPKIDAVNAARDRSGWQRLHIDNDNRKIHQPGGLLLDLSAVAKGYGVDRVAQYLERCGVLHYLVEVGGELRGSGIKPDHMPWWVALEQPATAGLVEHMPAAFAETVVALHGLSIATSGDYRRFYRTHDDHTHGSFISHTIDPRTGYPIRNDIASVTVLHTSCMAADALSTALTVLGIDDGLAFAETQQIAARFLVRNELACDGNSFSEHSSSAFQAMLQ